MLGARALEATTGGDADATGATVAAEALGGIIFRASPSACVAGQRSHRGSPKRRYKVFVVAEIMQKKRKVVLRPEACGKRKKNQIKICRLLKKYRVLPTARPCLILIIFFIRVPASYYVRALISTESTSISSATCLTLGATTS